MELIDEWSGRKRVAAGPAGGPAPATAQAFRDALAGLEPLPLSVHCYEDVSYPWIQVVFMHLISPGVARQVARRFAGVTGNGSVYFNSLRPRAVYFLVEPGFDDPAPGLPASRYGATLDELEKSWP
ncbi:MAG: hypothetical protein RL375_1774 [Pseudomonadota bacterium]